MPSPSRRYILIKSFFQRLPFLIQLPLARKLALAAALLSFSCCLLVILASQQQIRDLHQSHIEELGSQLSEQLAINARPALMQGDPLSLQALLVELTNSPSILQAAVFNIENKPVAEAGERVDGKAFMAPIHFQDTIAGHSLIVIDSSKLDTQVSGLMLQQILLSLLFAGCCYALALWAGGKLSHILNDVKLLISAANYPSNTKRKKLSYWGEDEFQQCLQQILKGPNPANINHDSKPAALLQISIVDQAGQALSNEQLDKYRHQLNTVCKLYEGRLALTRPNSFSAWFYQNKKESEHPFKALCCGKIIEQLLNLHNKELSFSIKLLMSEHSNEHHQQALIDQALQWKTGQQFSIDDSVLKHPSVKDRLCDETISNSPATPSFEFNARYNELIDRQFSALQLQFDRRK